MDGVVPEYDLSKFPALQQHKEDVDKHLQEYITNLKTLKLRAGLSSIMRYLHSAFLETNPRADE
jgi:methionyl-tRNA synthetase